MLNKEDKGGFPRLKGLVFDFDGTLGNVTIDFKRLRARLNEIAAVFHDDPPVLLDEPILEWIDRVAALVAEERPEDGLEFHSRGRMTVTGFEMDGAAAGALYSFARPVLADLNRRGVATAIVTRNCTAAVKEVFPDLSSYCPLLLAREDTPKVKPDPAHALLALKKMEVNPVSSLMVGDHPMDIAGGKNAGMFTAGVCGHADNFDQLNSAGADIVFDNCQSLFDHLIERDIV